MKCIKNGSEIRRVSDQDAMDMVKNGWKYCPKHEWKNKGSKPVPTESIVKVTAKKSMKQTKKDKAVDSVSETINMIK